MNLEYPDSNQSNPFSGIANEIKLIAVDVDGVLTDGVIYSIHTVFSCLRKTSL